MLSALEGARELRPGLWGYEAFHLIWKRQVVTTVWRGAEEVVLIDPLVPDQPPRARAFWDALDVAVADDAAALSILLTVFFHGRSAPAIVERYAAFGAQVLAPADAVGKLAFGSVAGFAAGEELPAGIRAFATPRIGEVVFYVPEPRAVVAGDILLGGTRVPLRVCPQSWLPSSTSRAEVAAALAPLRDLDVDVVVSGHGAPVEDDAAAALGRALTSAGEAAAARRGP